VKYDDAVTILNTFRHKLMPYFPFVLITPETTLDQLRAEMPFLLLAILKVSLSRNTATQQLVEGTFQSAVADRMIFSHNPSMDVLQGLLIALAWSLSPLSL
jgi:branched-subunit amino acid transport protein AzlD